MSREFGEIVLVRFPFTNQTGSKQRPAVIVSSSYYNGSRPDVVIMPVTGQLRPSPQFGEVWIQDWQSAQLLKPSAIKPVFATIEQILILKSLGALKAHDQQSLRRAISAVLG